MPITDKFKEEQRKRKIHTILDQLYWKSGPGMWSTERGNYAADIYREGYGEWRWVFWDNMNGKALQEGIERTRQQANKTIAELFAERE